MIRPPACGSQCGAPRPTKAGNKDDAAGIGHAGGQSFHFGGRADEAEIVAQPLHHRAANEDAAFKRVLEPFLGACRDGGDELVLRADELRADVLEQEASSAVGIFSFTGIPAELAEERGLLIACDSGDGDAAQTERRGDVANRLARPNNFREHALGDVEDAQQFRIPLAFTML